MDCFQSFKLNFLLCIPLTLSRRMRVGHETHVFGGEVPY
jgi:hypothetical protein